MKFKAILDKACCQDVPTLTVRVGTIGSAKAVSSVVLHLQKTLPIPALQHLKRVKRVGDDTFLVVLDAVDDADETPKRKRPPKIENLLDEYQEVEVPAFGPKTRAQYEQCMKIWPVNFHPEKSLEQLVQNEMFTRDEEDWHSECMSQVVGKCVALVGDPRKKIVVAIGMDKRDVHPLQHSVFSVLDIVAGQQQQMACVSGSSEAYLCTSWDIYLSREPCPMCAMALVHSRVSRVFFGSRQCESGALVSTCQIQFLKNLNHHYQVFEVDSE